MCVLTEMTNIGEILYFLFDTIVNMLCCYSVLKKLCMLTILMLIVYFVLRSMFGFIEFFLSLLPISYKNGTYSYLVKITIEK